MFKAFGRETLSFPKPSLWERPEGSLLVRAGQALAPLLPTLLGRERNQVHHLSGDVRGEAGPTAGTGSFKVQL